MLIEKAPSHATQRMSGDWAAATKAADPPRLIPNNPIGKPARSARSARNSRPPVGKALGPERRSPRPCAHAEIPATLFAENLDWRPLLPLLQATPDRSARDS